MVITLLEEVVTKGLAVRRSSLERSKVVFSIEFVKFFNLSILAFKMTKRFSGGPNRP